MDMSTPGKLSRAEQCRKNAKVKSDQKRRAVLAALASLQQDKSSVTRAIVARRAGVSLVFLRSHPDLLQMVDEAASVAKAPLGPNTPGDKTKDQIITALRRRLEDLKHTLAAKDVELRQKQQEIARLYGKLAVSSPLIDNELREAYQALLCALNNDEEMTERS